MPKPIIADDKMVDLSFPVLGLDLAQAFAAQRKDTTPLGVNVRAYDPITQRARGGSRPGIARYVNGQVNGSNWIQELQMLVSTGFAGASGGNILPPPGWPDTLDWPPAGWPVPGSNPYDPANPPPGWPFALWPPFGFPFEWPGGPFLPGFDGTLGLPPLLFGLFFIPGGGGESPSTPSSAMGLFVGTVPGFQFSLHNINSTLSVAGVLGPPAVLIGWDADQDQMRLVSNGLSVADVSLFVNPDPATICFTASGGSFYVAGATVSRQLFAAKLDSAGNYVWQQPLGGALDCQNRFCQALIGGSILYVYAPSIINPSNGGIAQIDAVTGNVLTPLYLVTDAQVIAAAPGYDLQSTASAGTNLMCVVQECDCIALVIRNFAADAFNVGVAFAQLGSGLLSTLVGLGAGILSGGGSKNLGMVTTDGRYAYFMAAPWTLDVTVQPAVVYKIDPLDGSILWTTADFGAAFTAICYVAETQQLILSGPLSSLTLSPESGVVIGGGIGAGLSNLIDGGVPTPSLALAGGGNPSSAMQQNRAVILVAVSGGTAKVKYNSSWQPIVNGEQCLSPAVSVVRSAVNQGKIWFVDGTVFKVYDPLINQIDDWLASAGQLPTDDAGNAPRLIETWRGRTVLSGLPLDPQNWFMSGVDDPTNWDYSPLSPAPTDPVAGNNSPAGMVGEPVTCLIPYSDDVLIFGGDRTIWTCTGDPQSGGQIDRVSDSIGIAWGRPWCKDPYGTVYFVSNLCAIYSMTPGQQPQRISQQIEQPLSLVKLDQVVIRLLWDDALQGIHVYITPFALPQPATHFFWEMRTNAWWMDQFANAYHNPMCCLQWQGDRQTDRVALLGSWDGYVRANQFSAVNDDGTPISSAVVLGPLLTRDLDDVMLKELQGVLAASSSEVSFAVYVGTTAELALSSSPVVTGTWSAGRNFTNLIRFSGHAIYVKLTAVNIWALEQVRAKIATLGKVRQRGGR